MVINELVTRKKADLVSIKEQDVLFETEPKVEYALVDSSKYSFVYKYNDDIEVNMFESDRSFDNDEFIDAEFDDSISEKDHSYYIAAVASGLLTGAFSQLKLAESSLEKINKWKNSDWEKYIIIAAQIAGYKKSDLKGAVSFLKDRFVPYVNDSLNKEVKEGLDEWLRFLSNHPSLAGLVFSVFTQYSGERYKFGEKQLVKEPVPEYYAIGRNAVEKLAYGFLYWVFNVAVDVAVSNRTLLEDIKMPKEVMTLLKELYKFPIFRNIPSSYNDSEKLFSEWITKTFENSRYKDDEGEEKEFDLHEEIESLSVEAFNKSAPVLINECIVRCFYFLKKFTVEIKNKEIRTFADLDKVDIGAVLPFNNRLISRMVLISSGCFVGVNVTGATIKAVLNRDKKGGEFAKTLLAEVDIVGVGRFIFACVADSKYWSDDIKVILQRRDKKKKGKDISFEDCMADEQTSSDAFAALTMDAIQTRILYSLETVAILKDIEHTVNIKDKDKKKTWLESWQSMLLKGMGITEEGYFVTNEELIYGEINKVTQTEEYLKWFYLIASELIVFKPYFPLHSKEDAEYKKLKRDKYNYIDDQFARKQTIINQTEIDAIRDAYKKYKGLVSGNTQNTIIAAGVAAVTAVASGGLAFVFAPGIATLIAGEAVVGLHGAALTSASLALVGGGSLAAGGLGMAGGTAIITGGGALLGVAGSGSASMAAILSQTNSDILIRLATKMLVFSKCVLKDRFNDIEALDKLSKAVDVTINKVEKNLEELEEEKCSLDKDTIKDAKAYLKYLNRCRAELGKIK
ncbi:hypothetical protein [Butyrivibrio sp. MC2021]|uniref:hypothetical protein n=1 Tax=Butyrivibrio sp. MC2021 TaxID=1408306 RepID=UPI00047CDF1C|nr:hypothetical protein [Butyrivibrio sp. MC2021]